MTRVSLQMQGWRGLVSSHSLSFRIADRADFTGLTTDVTAHAIVDYVLSLLTHYVLAGPRLCR